MTWRRAVVGVLSVAALGGTGVLATGCAGGGSATTPATTAAGGVTVYDPDHRMITLAPGPPFIVRMPDPGDGQRWRLYTPEGMGGVSLKGLQNAGGAGDWYFDTIGAGEGTLEFRKTPLDSEASSESMTYEVKIG